MLKNSTKPTLLKRLFSFSQIVRFFHLRKLKPKLVPSIPALTTFIKISPLLLLGPIVCSSACAKIDVDDISTGGLAPEKPITWYLVDAPAKSKNSRLAIPLQPYSSDKQSLSYYVPTLSDRVYRDKMAQKCREEGKNYGGMVGAFFALAHNPPSSGINLNGRKVSTVNKIQAPVVSSASGEYSHQFISSLQETPYNFTQPNAKQVGFPLVFASVHIADNLLENLDRSIAYNKQRQLKMRIHHNGYDQQHLKTNAHLALDKGKNSVRIASNITVEEQRTQFSEYQLTNYPIYQQQTVPNPNKRSNIGVIRAKNNKQRANVAMQASLFVACQDK